MIRNQTDNTVLPTDWTEVVGKVHEVLTQTETAAAEREKKLAKVAPSISTKEKAKKWKQNLESFEKHLQLFQGAVQKAEDNAEEADLALADAEKALNDWLKRATVLSSKTI
jgi:hypothetical protein